MKWMARATINSRARISSLLFGRYGLTIVHKANITSPSPLSRKLACFALLRRLDLRFHPQHFLLLTDLEQDGSVTLPCSSSLLVVRAKRFFQNRSGAFVKRL